MKYYGFSGIFVTVFLCNYLSATTSQTMVTAIEQRRYMIKRLEKTIATLVEAHKKKVSVRLEKDTAKDFKDPIVHRAFVAIERTQSVVPFYTLWSSFLAYQFIDNKEFIKEILTAILLLYKDLILSLQKNGSEQKWLLQSIDTHTQKSDDTIGEFLPMLADADVAHDQYKVLCATTDCYELNAVLVSSHTLEPVYPTDSLHSIEENIGTVNNLLDEDEMDTIATDNTMRFYYIQRLLKSMFILSRQKYTIPFVFDETIFNSLRSPALKKCLDELVTQKSVVPLFNVWSTITAYDFINDTNYVREFVLVACLSYQQILNMTTSSSDTKAVHAQDVLAMYEKLATLPVAELLDLLDDVVEQYDTLAQQYALKDSSLTWKQWFEKYWWSAPIMVSSFAATLLKHAKVLLFSANTRSCFKK